MKRAFAKDERHVPKTDGGFARGCPKDLPDETYRVLHNSFVDIFKMRRSIEGVDALVEQSTKAILESREMLKHLQSAGF